MRYFFVNLPYFILLISLLVFFHELGHFLVAKLCGVRVLRFSLGFGPKLFSHKRGHTEYLLCALPLGGYVKMFGDTPGSHIAPEEASFAFNNKKIWQRTAIVLAGPAFNMILALLVYFGMAYGTHDFGDTHLGVVSINEPAYLAGLRPGDKITAVERRPVANWNALREAVAKHLHKPVRITFERDGQSREVTLTTQGRAEANAFAEMETRGRIGVSLQYLRPQLGVVDPHSPACVAGLKTGDVIVKVAGVPVGAWHEVRALVYQQPPGAPLLLEVRRQGATLPPIYLHASAARPELSDNLFSAAEPSWGYFGLANQNTVIAKVEPEGAAAQAGMLVGDRLLALHIRSASAQRRTLPIGVWEIDLTILGLGEGGDLAVSLQRGSDVIERSFRLQEKLDKGGFNNAHSTFVLGAENSHDTLDTYTVRRDVGIGEALVTSAQQVGGDISLIFRGIVKMVSGSLPADSVGGPVMLFVIAEKSAKQGISIFLRTLAVISVNIGMVNLLPIPVLDGGHLFFYLIELVRRREPSVRTREVAQMIGVGFLLLLMVWAFRNDVMRFMLQ